MELLKFNPDNRQYYSEEFIKGFEVGAKRQFEADSAETDRKMGKWILRTDEKLDVDYYVCSNCGYEPYRKMDISNYCPNCGADMRGEDDD